MGTARITFPTTEYMTLAPNSSKNVFLSSAPAANLGDNIYLGIGSVQGGPGVLTANDRLVLLTAQGVAASIYPRP